MATLVLSAVGAAVGAGFGGTVLGLSGAVIGRAIGATLGQVIDQRILGGGTEAVETGRIDRLRLMGAGEGAPIPRLWGRMRMGGHVIWSTQFNERSSRSGGGKGRGPEVTSYSYSISLALALCEGEILGIGRIWADGAEIASDTLNLRVYSGSEDQLPDPKIEAVEGAGRAPAYRGLAYVVIEDLNLAPYGNRVPQLSFEVMRAAQGHSVGSEPTLGDAIRAVAMIPGTGEYALATRAIYRQLGPDEVEAVNLNTASGQSDIATSLAQLGTELPNVGSISLVVSWFGDDLRCGHCQIKPMVEQQSGDAAAMPWKVSGMTRATAEVMPSKGGRSVYGGTPTDQSVIQAIRAIADTGREVMFYPFILMTQQEGNSLPNPLTGEIGQPVMPWRGRITLSAAPGMPGSTDRTAAAATEVAAFFGNAQASDFTRSTVGVSYHGAEDWGFRRFILHAAHLCAAAGGVDAFCLGSEMVGLTRIRDDDDNFPAVEALRTLAADVRGILGPDCKLTYAADWTEYGSHSADGNLYFPLDALWADPEIDFIGIDNYMPLSDWRDGVDHKDASWGACHSLDYLRANIAGGEGFDWYYDSPEGEAAQIRLPIEDGAHDEPWVYRVKDLKSWWSLPHHPRSGATRHSSSTAWVPKSKPIRFTEYGCAAIDKGANQPNRFLDGLSSESALPRASNGARDDLMQMQYLRAFAGFWTDPDNNPTSAVYGGRMVETEYSHAWAWDARPFPAFPGRSDLWSDGASYRAGHWLNGRATGQPLDAVIREIAANIGSEKLSTATCHGVLRGYAVDRIQSARASLQPLLLAYGLDAAERDGQLHFRSRLPGVDHQIAPERLAVTEGLDGMAEIVRQAAAEVPSALRLSHIEADGDFAIRMADAQTRDHHPQALSVTELPLVLTGAEGQTLAARWLSEARIARDGLRLALPRAALSVGPGDRLALPDGSAYRVERLEDVGPRLLEAVRIEGGIYAPNYAEDVPALMRPHIAPTPVRPLLLDLPLLTGAESPHQPHIAVSVRPWTGTIAVWAAPLGGEFTLNRLVAAPATMGETETDLPRARPGIWDKGQPLRIRLMQGQLESRSTENILAGGNAMAIGSGDGDHWEVFQFASATPVAPRVWDLAMRLRGQAGTDGVMPDVWPRGSRVVLLDDALVQLDLPPSLRGVAQQYRIGHASRPFDDPTVAIRQMAFDGVGLRPYPVAHLRQRAEGDGTHVFTWIRRTRIDGDNWQQPDVPLGEEREAYLLRVADGAGAVIREVTLNAPGFAYTPAMRAADGMLSGYTLLVAQLSDRFGPGPFRHLTVS